jgi:hypothetical protein
MKAANRTAPRGQFAIIACDVRRTAAAPDPLAWRETVRFVEQISLVRPIISPNRAIIENHRPVPRRPGQGYMNRQETIHLLEQFDLKPVRSLGQNFSDRPADH